MSIEEELVNLLIDKKYFISFAESLTGGLCSSKIVNISNASKVLSESYVTYHDEAKEKILNVNKNTIDKYNVVSIEVAREMVLGLYNITHSNVCVSLTGVAGPLGGTKEIPVGTVCMGFLVNDSLILRKEIFTGSRNEIREKAANYALKTVIELVNLEDENKNN